MSKKNPEIPDSAIQQLNGTSMRVWYRLDTNPAVTVTSGKNKHGDWTFVCHSCADRNDNCCHTRAVRRYCGKPMRKTEGVAA